MNDAISQLSKRGKKKSKLEQLLLVDHSNIYFENERLAEKLAKYLDELQREQHLLFMQHDAEKRELEELIESLQSMKKVSSEKTRILLEKLDSISAQKVVLPIPEKKIRPHTTGSYFTRTRNKSEERGKSEPVADDRKDLHLHSLSDDEGGEARQKEKRKISKDNKENNIHRESTGKQKERKYPEYYYNSVIPADDSCLKRVRNDFRRQQTAPALLSSRGGRRKDDDMKHAAPSTAYGSRKNSTSDDGEGNKDGESRMKLLCNRQSRPIMMSLRQMKELTNMDNESDAVTKRQREKIERCLQRNQRQFDELTVRMKSFLQKIDAKIAQDVEDTKQKEIEKDDMYFGVLPPDQMPH